jgi:hypothetical protein
VLEQVECETDRQEDDRAARISAATLYDVQDLISHVIDDTIFHRLALDLVRLHDPHRRKEAERCLPELRILPGGTRIICKLDRLTDQDAKHTGFDEGFLAALRIDERARDVADDLDEVYLVLGLEQKMLREKLDIVLSLAGKTYQSSN